MGLSFVPSQTKISASEINYYLRDFANRIFWRAFWRLTAQPPLPTSINLLNQHKFCTTHSTRRPITTCPENIQRKFPDLQRFTTETKQLVRCLTAKMHPLKIHNCSEAEITLLKQLRHHRDFVVKPADKNLGTVLIARPVYYQMCMDEIDKMVTQRLTLPEMRHLISQCKSDLRYTIMPLLYHKLAKRVDPLLKINWILENKIPTLYCLPKVHKATIRGRPIISAAALPFGVISAYVGWRLNQVIASHPWLGHYLVKDSTSVIRRLEGFQPCLNNLTGIQFDVVELYPSLPTNAIIERLRTFLLTEGTVTPSEVTTLMIIIKFLFRNGWFSFHHQYYRQVDGLAMGHPHSPPLANIIVYLLIEQDLDLNRTPAYCRFLDDGFFLFNGSKSSIQALFHEWETRSGLRFTWEMVDIMNGEKAEFLDLSLFMVDGKLQCCTHQKKLNKYLYINSSSMHPRCTKASIIKTELIRYIRTCSRESDFAVVKDKFWKRLRNRGYSRFFLRDAFQSVSYSQRDTFLAPRPQFESDFKILIFKMRFTLETSQLRLGRRITALLDDRIRTLLGLIPGQTVISCHIRSQNLRNFLVRTGDAGMDKI